MELIRRLATFGYGRPRLILVAAADATESRLTAERWIREHGWPVASAPADADVLLECGELCGPLRDATHTVFEEMPFPRSRAQVDAHASADEVGQALLSCRSELVDVPTQRAGAQPAGTTRQHTPDPDGDHGGMDHGGDHGGMDHSAHMGVVDGLPMASRADDRDGLKLDALRVPLGPVLPAWPAGLVLTLTVQGDIVQDVAVDDAYVGALRESYWNEPFQRALRGETASVADAELRRAASYLDSLSRLLELAGAVAEAKRCVLLRDAALSGSLGDAAVTAGGIARRLRRSRLLRWMTDGLGVLTVERAAAAGVTGPALRASGLLDDSRVDHPSYPGFRPVPAEGAGDVISRMLRWAAEAEQALQLAAVPERALYATESGLEGPRGRLTGAGETGPSAALLRVLPGLLAGCDLAGARLIVASLDPDLAECADVAPAAPAPDDAVRHSAHHGGASGHDLHPATDHAEGHASGAHHD